MNVRVGIDLDSNRWIDWGGNSPLNLIPNPLYFTALDHAESNCTVADRLEKTNFGVELRRISFAAAGAAYHTLGTPSLPLDTVTEGYIYTSVVWIRSSNTLPVRLAVFKQDGVTQIATTASFPLTGEWQKLSCAFLCPVATTGVILRLVKINSGDVGNVEVTGYGIYESQSAPDFNSGTAPNLLPDPRNFTDLVANAPHGTTYAADIPSKYGSKMRYHEGYGTGITDLVIELPNVFVAKKPYTIVVWVENTYGTDPTGREFFISVLDHGTFSVLGQAPSARVNNNLRQFSIPFRMIDPSDAVDLYILQAYPFGASGAFSYRITGIGIYEGWSSVGYNDGPIDEVIEMLSFTTSAGMNNETGRMTATDGQIEILLNNETQIWNPRNAASPYFARLRSNSIIEVQISEAENGVWRQLWTGLYQNIEVGAGLTGSRQATIRGTQGLEYLNDERVLYPPTPSKRADQILASALSNALLASDRYSWVLGESQLGINNYLADGRTYSVLETTEYVYPVAAGGIDSDATARDFFDAVVINEGGFSFIDRLGRPVFMHRYIPPIDEDERRPGHDPIIRPVGL